MDWIYAHVDPEDRPHLSHTFLWVDGGNEGGVTHVAYMSILWSFGANSAALGYADEMVKAVKDVAGRDYPEVMLLDLQKQLGVTIIPGEYDPLKDIIVVNPVGEEWPAESEKRGVDCYHPVVRGEHGKDLPENWVDARGQFLLRAGQQWTALYYYYVKV